MKSLSVALFTLLFSLTTLAEGLFGPEWTFTSDELIEATQNSYTQNDYMAPFKLKSDYLEKWQQIIAQKCPNCEIAGNIIKVNDDFWFKLGTDPFVLELGAIPMTPSTFKANLDVIQDLVFDSAKAAGLKVHERLVGGHIHLDIKSNFGGDRLLIRNFIVDLYNHPELFMGALSHDYLNAPPVAVLGKQSLDKLEEILVAFDLDRLTVGRFFERISNEVYMGSETINAADKYQAVNLLHKDTIEIRGFRPQTSARHHLAMIKLLTARIEMLSKIRQPIPFKRVDYRDKYQFSESNKLHTYETKLPASQIVASYRDYVEGSGLNWSTYSEWFGDQRVANFLERQSNRSYAMACSAAFAGL